MSYKTDVELKTQVDAVIEVNGNREITPPLDNSIRTNFIDSKLNLAGGNVLLALTGYTTDLTPSDDKHLTPKKYVFDLDAEAIYLDGSRAWTGNQDAGGNDITNVNVISGSTSVITFDGNGVAISAGGILNVALAAGGGDITVESSNISVSTVPYIDADNNLVSSSITPTQLEIGVSLYGSATGTDTYASSLVIAAYQEGRSIFLKFANTNTGASTININTLGAKSIVKNGSSALVGGEINAGQIVHLMYDGTNFQII